MNITFSLYSKLAVSKAKKKCVFCVNISIELNMRVEDWSDVFFVRTK